MLEPFDIYTDQFLVTITPFGANLSFSAVEPHPSPNALPKSVHLGTVRMSVEHMKAMIVIMRNQIRSVEAQVGSHADLPTQVLSQMHISREDWDAFWK